MLVSLNESLTISPSLISTLFSNSFKDFFSAILPVFKLFKTCLIKFVMKIINLIITITIFLLGFLSASFLYGLVDSGYEVPLLKNLGLNSIGLINFSEKAPSDSINENQIEIYNDKIILNIGGASLSEYAPT